MISSAVPHWPQNFSVLFCVLPQVTHWSFVLTVTAFVASLPARTPRSWITITSLAPVSKSEVQRNFWFDSLPGTVMPVSLVKFNESGVNTDMGTTDFSRRFPADARG